MSEAALFEKLLMRIQALEARVHSLESASGTQLSEDEALSRWEAFMLAADVNSIMRCWREMETEDLHASSIGLTSAALAKLKQSMSRNAWSMLVEEIQQRQPFWLAHTARTRALHLLRQLQEMGEIVVAGDRRETQPSAINWDSIKIGFESWQAKVLGPLA